MTNFKIKFKHYFDYLIYGRDADPIYLFDHRPEEMKDIRDEFPTPKYFEPDLYSILKNRTDFATGFLLIGQKRTGVRIHQDSKGVDTGQTQIFGRKLWMLLPPETPKEIVTGAEFVKETKSYKGLDYLTILYPRILAKYKDLLKPIWFMQYPGETFYSPIGWWHVVVNIDDSIAISTRLLYENNLEEALASIKLEYPELLGMFIDALRENRNDLYLKAESLGLDK